MGDCDPGADPWIEQWFHDCVYNTRDYLGFACGLAAILLWITAQLPQFYNNYKNKSAEALSPWFLAQWLLGDTFNLLGCLMQGEQLPTTTYTAMYFVLADMFMMMQYIYYGALQKRRERILRLQAERRQRRRHQHPPRTQPIEAAPANPTTSRSDSILRPAAAAQNQQPSGGSNSHPMLRQPPNGKQESCHAAGHPAATPQQVGQQLPGSCAAAATRSRSELPSQLPGAAQAPMRPAAVLLSLGALAMVASVALLSTGGPGSTHAVAGTMGSRAMLASPQSLAAMQAAASGAGGGGQAASSALEGPTAAGGVQRPGGGGGGAPSARAASFGPRAAVFDAPDDWMKVAGTFLGWVSSVLYLSSRVSQILKNRSRQDTEGLAVAMFMVAVSANFCTGTGIILRTFSWQELQDQAPWIVGSLGTIMLDLTILAQSRRYAALHAAGGGGGGGGARSHARPQDDDGDGSDQPLLMV